MTTPQELRDRTKKFAIQIVRLCRKLPQDWAVQEIGKQLIRSGTGVAANYRAAQRGRSDKEFCSKIGVVVEEADESELWVELLPEAYPEIDSRVQRELLTEAGELTAIFSASHRTAKANIEKRKLEKKRERARKARSHSHSIIDHPIVDRAITRSPDRPIFIRRFAQSFPG